MVTTTEGAVVVVGFEGSAVSCWLGSGAAGAAPGVASRWEHVTGASSAGGLTVGATPLLSATPSSPSGCSGSLLCFPLLRSSLIFPFLDLASPNCPFLLRLFL